MGLRELSRGVARALPHLDAREMGLRHRAPWIQSLAGDLGEVAAVGSRLEAAAAMGLETERRASGGLCPPRREPDGRRGSRERKSIGCLEETWRRRWGYRLLEERDDGQALHQCRHPSLGAALRSSAGGCDPALLPALLLLLAGRDQPGPHHRIAIAVDLFDESAFTVKWAVQNYLRPGDAVVLLHVRPTSVLYGADWGSILVSIADEADAAEDTAASLLDVGEDAEGDDHGGGRPPPGGKDEPPGGPGQLVWVGGGW
jgi:hypothetical protein|uniref:UspA domain-containing protein n=1 Tax=Zea mays TaxID=4577 RepID=A0A804PAS5_MAIZE